MVMLCNTLIFHPFNFSDSDWEDFCDSQVASAEHLSGQHAVDAENNIEMSENIDRENNVVVSEVEKINCETVLCISNTAYDLNAPSTSKVESSVTEYGDVAERDSPYRDNYYSPCGSPVSRISSAPSSTHRVIKNNRKRMLVGKVFLDCERLCHSAPSVSKRRNGDILLHRDHPVVISFKQISPSLSFLYQAGNGNYMDQCFVYDKTTDLLGTGSFGAAYRVTSKEDGRNYAIKRTAVESASKSIRDERVAEIRKHESLPDHPNLVKLFYAWEEKGHFYLVMELCAKKDLRTLLPTKKKPVNPRVQEPIMWSYFIDILLAVDFLHKRDLIHCDIKPANAFITLDDVCKLGDFGLLFNERLDKRDVDMDEGDGKYLAYEAFEMGPTKTGDIFSLGITLLEVSTDKVIPTSCDRYWLRDGRVIDEFMEGIPRETAELIHAMTVVDFKCRPSTSEILEMGCVRRRLNQRQTDIHKQHNIGCNPSVSF